MSVVTRTTNPTPEDELTVTQMVAEMQRLREIMERDQADIERLKVENLAIKLETQRLLRELEASVLPC